jgi:hypothetical protein
MLGRRDWRREERVFGGDVVDVRIVSRAMASRLALKRTLNEGRTYSIVQEHQVKSINPYNDLDILNLDILFRSI